MFFLIHNLLLFTVKSSYRPPKKRKNEKQGLPWGRRQEPDPQGGSGAGLGRPEPLPSWGCNQLSFLHPSGSPGPVPGHRWKQHCFPGSRPVGPQGSWGSEPVQHWVSQHGSLLPLGPALYRRQHESGVGPCTRRPEPGRVPAASVWLDVAPPDPHGAPEPASRERDLVWKQGCCTCPRLDAVVRMGPHPR